MHLVFLDGFWIVYIPLGRMIKIQTLAQFAVDHLSHSVMASLVLLLC